MEFAASNFGPKKPETNLNLSEEGKEHLADLETIMELAGTPEEQRREIIDHFVNKIENKTNPDFIHAAYVTALKKVREIKNNPRVNLHEDGQKIKTTEQSTVYGKIETKKNPETIKMLKEILSTIEQVIVMDVASSRGGKGPRLLTENKLNRNIYQIDLLKKLIHLGEVDPNKVRDLLQEEYKDFDKTEYDIALEHITDYLNNPDKEWYQVRHSRL